MPTGSLKVWPTVSTRLKSLVNLDPADDISPSLIEHECQICLFEYPSFIMVSACSKGHKFCKTCLEQYLKSKVLDLKGSESICCPQDSCNQPCVENVIRTLLSDNERKLYEGRKLKKTLTRNPHLKFCPQSNCSRIYEISKATRYTICKCQSKICNACGDFWHEGKTCQQASDAIFEEYLKKNENLIKCCVKCKTAVQRTEGCLHITCPACDYEWCWSCGRKCTSLHLAKCPKKWMPEAQKKARLTWDSRKTQKLRDIIALILLIPLKLVLFGFFVCDLWKVIKETEKMRTKIFVLIFSLLITFVYNGIIFGLIGAITEASPGNEKRALVGALGFVFVPFLLFMLRESFKVCFREKSGSKKWNTRIANNFEFIPTQKSTLYGEYNNSPSTAVPVGNVLDGIFDDEESQYIKAFEIQKVKLAAEHQGKNELGEILDRIFSEDPNLKEKSITLENALEENNHTFYTHDALKEVVEDDKELSEIKVV